MLTQGAEETMIFWTKAAFCVQARYFCITCGDVSRYCSNFISFFQELEKTEEFVRQNAKLLVGIGEVGNLNQF